VRFLYQHAFLPPLHLTLRGVTVLPLTEWAFLCGLCLPLTPPFIHSIPPSFPFLLLSISVEIDQLTQEQVGRLHWASTCSLDTALTHWRLPKILLYWLRGEGDDKYNSLCGGTLSVAVSRNLFRKNRILYTMIVGVKKGGTWKKASLCMALVVLNSHLHGDGPICFSTVYTMTDWIREGFQGFPFCSWRVTVIHPGQCAGGKLR
jgi:hypothetical protein